MKKTLNRPLAGVSAGALATLMATLLVACGGSGGAASEVAQSAAEESTASTSALAKPLAAKSAPAAATVVSQPVNTDGRLLASNCFQCHGTMGTGGFDAIRGQEANEVLEFLRKPASSGIMAAHAQGYTPAQLQKIIAYLQQ